MTDRMLRQVLAWAGAALAATVGGSLAWAQSSITMGVLAGGVWNLLSLWWLTRLFAAWLGPKPSQRRVIGWLLLKFPLLYVVAIGLMSSGWISGLAFGVGFTVVLFAAIAGLIVHSRHLFVGHPTTSLKAGGRRE